MSKSKSKSVPSGSKPDILSKVKGAAVEKPAQSVKVKSKELAKKVAEKGNKKKKVKEPTPEPESEDDEESGSSSEEESDSEEEEVETKGANGVKAVKDNDSSEESDSDESASEDEAPKLNGSAPKAADVADASDSEEDDESESDEDEDESSDEGVDVAKAADSDEDDSSDESESDDEEKAAPKTNGARAAKVDKEESDDDEEADSSEDEDSDKSDDSEESEEEVEAKPTKRKAEEADAPAAKKSKVEDVDTSKGSNLFIGNLSWHVDEDWLRQEFEEYGELSGVRLITDRDSGRSKGYGYVEFVNAADAAKAHAEKQGAELDGRVMNVDFANARSNTANKQENRRKSYGDQLSEPTETLFLGNLSFEVTQDDIYEAFAPHGTISGVRLPTDRDTGAPKGFGYVTFASLDEAKAAVEAMQGAFISNRPVRVDFTQPRPQQGDSPARGGGGFGGRGGRGGFGGRGRGGGRGDFGGRGGRGGGRGGRGGSTNRGGFGDFSGRKTTF